MTSSFGLKRSGPSRDDTNRPAPPLPNANAPFSFCGLRLLVPQNGFRPGIDALLLASFAKPEPGDRVIELGAGSGAVSLLLASRYRKALSFLAVEIAPGEARAIEENARLNAEPRVRSICADYTRLRLPNRYHLVVANPPFFHLDLGTMPAAPERLRAKWEILATMEETVASARRLLLADGRLTLVYPAKRTRELARRLDDHGLAPRRWLHVSSVEGKPARFVLVEAIHLPSAQRPPTAEVRHLSLLTREGHYTDAAAGIYGYERALAMPRGGRRPAAARPQARVSKERSLHVC